jgi:hypothetical protein
VCLSFVCRPSVKRTKTELECEWRVEYVTESSGVTGEENHNGWVVKKAIGDLHELKYRQGSFYALETDQDPDTYNSTHRTEDKMIGSPRTRKLGKKILQKTKKRGKKQIFTSEETRGGRLL